MNTPDLGQIADPGPTAHQRQSFGSILSREPLVTISKRSHFHLSPAGIGPLTCANDPTGQSLHFLFLAWSHETPEAVQSLARDVDEAFRPFPGAHVVVLANTAGEARAIRDAGLEAEEVNLLLAVDEARYARVDPEPDFPPCSAIYVAALEPYKRHDLAVGVAGLRLLYWRPSAGNLASVRRLLPMADFANHRLGGGPHALATGVRYCAAVQSAGVGLCLSDKEGPMRASVEYGLLGLPIVTTSALGGRVEFMDHAHARVVPVRADAVASAVGDMARDRAPVAVVRAAALARLARERAHFADVARDRATRIFGAPIDALTAGHPRTWELWRTRTVAEIIQAGSGR
jgi:hypothetical protein